jgi:hypothetical protein
VSQFKYLGTVVTNQNLIQEEIKRRFENRILRKIFGTKRDEVMGR